MKISAHGIVVKEQMIRGTWPKVLDQLVEIEAQTIYGAIAYMARNRCVPGSPGRSYSKIAGQPKVKNRGLGLIHTSSKRPLVGNGSVN